MNPQNVLIVSDDGDFARTVIARWQSELTLPSFTVMDTNTFSGARITAGQVAIVGGIEGGRLSSILEMTQSESATICVAKTMAQAQALRTSYARVVALAQHEGWVDSLVLVAVEVLRRVDALRRANEAEAECQGLQQLATLGEYMLEMRHSFSNSLTSILGNAELLLLEPGSLTADMRDQLNTIHNMSLRMHEVMQRFSSLESEMRFAENTSHAETLHRVDGSRGGVSGAAVLPASVLSAKTYSAKLK
jgi:signal transduction histidine kinase